MATNREKYINNASDEELITRLGCNSCIYKDNDCRNNGPGQTCDSGKLKWLSQAAEKSADEMFEELGYKKVDDTFCLARYDNKEKNNISIFFYEDYSYTKAISGFAIRIFDEEDKAIHKKLEELKNEQKRNRE